MMDLCLTCQQNTTKLQRAANLSDEEKSDCVKAHQEHLDIAQSKRECYRNPGKECERFLQTIDTNTLLICETRGACSLNASIHYSWLCTTDTCTKQWLNNHDGLGEHHAHLYADNCTGQNKNSFFLWYLTYRILLKLHRSITYSFLIAGHTKFGPDQSFGLIKKVYKVTHVSSSYEFARLVETSSNSGLNKVQLVGTHDGRIIVTVHDWASFLGQYFRKFPNIKKCHHFRFS